MNKKIVVIIVAVIAAIFLITKIIPMLGSDTEKIRKVIHQAKSATEKENLFKCMSYISTDYRDRHDNSKGNLLRIGKSAFNTYDDILIVMEDVKINIIDKTNATANIIASGQSRRVGEQKARYLFDTERVKFDVTFKKEGNNWRVVNLDFTEPSDFMQFLMGL